MTSPRIAYLVNQYPKVSHTFIRREILALERQGFEILRVALRGWDAKLMDEADAQEQARTQYILRDGIIALLGSTLRTLAATPRKFLFALGLALNIARQSKRPLIRHLVCLAEACRLLPWLATFGARHVHAHFGTNSAEIVMLARALGGPPYSFTVHGPEEFDSPQTLVIGEKVRRSAFVIAITSFARSQLLRWVEQAHWAKIKVVRCGIDTAFYAGQAQPPPEAPRLIAVGRLSPEKGHLLLVEAVGQLVERGIKIELVLVGDGDLRSEIAASVERLSLKNAVHMTGLIPTENLRAEILGSRGLVQPSFAEGLPMTIMEAMALHRPVLATWIAGIPELVESGEHGWLVPAGSVDALASALADFVSRPVEDLQVMGAAAHRRVLERHSADVEAAKLAALVANSLHQ